ncbi:MAG: FKBP-type peptidyl-prolyl cis-trans isomerase [Pseudomonadota bacterium]
MLRFSGVILAGALALTTLPTLAQEATELDTPEKRFSYAIGQNIGTGIKDDLGAAGFDPDAFIAAVRDVFGEGGKLTEEQMQAAFAELQAKQQEAQAQAAVAALAENKKWLEAKAAEDGVSATESGILYTELSGGEGAKPTAADSVTVHYTGRLADGKVFDSSVDRGQPATFPLGGVIPGWTEILQLMPVGSKWDVWIPSELGYGPRGAGGDIPPNAILHFTIELLSIEGQ